MAAANKNVDAGKADAFDAFLKDFDQAYPGELRALSDPTAADVDVISSGVISLDVALGTGGFPRGRVTEIYGPTGGGKTTLALSTAHECQKAGGRVAFIDCEQALSRELAISVGVDLDSFFVVQPNFGEETIDQVERMLRAKAFDMIIVDSVAAMIPKSALDADADGSQQMGRHAALMSKFMLRIIALVAKSDTMVLLLNQVRVNLGAYGAPEAPTGGKAIGFYSSVRVEVRTSAGRQIKKGTEVVGTTVKAVVKKNKLAAPFRDAEYDIIFGQGINCGGALLDVCENLGLISRGGASYTDVLTGERIGIGKEKVKEILANDPELTERFTKAVYATLADRRTGSSLPVGDDMVDDGNVDPDGYPEFAESDDDVRTVVI